MRQWRLGLAASTFLLLCIPLAAKSQVVAGGEAAVIRPTDNAFDALIQAGNESLDNPATASGKIIAAAEADGATLTQKRAATREVAFRNALSRLRDALGRPIQQIALEAIDAYTPMRRLARLLTIEQYVLLADGKVPTALDSFADSLALCDIARTRGMAGIAWGGVIEDAAIKSLSTHLDQLSHADCSHLFALLADRRNAPNPAVAALQAMVEVRKRSIAALGDNLPPAASDAALKSAFNSGNNDDPDIFTVEEDREIVRMRTQDPAAWARFQSDTVSLFAAEFNGIADRINNGSPKPAATAVDADTKTTPDVVARLAEKFYHAVSYSTAQQSRTVDRAISSQARRQLLAVHAAILKWRWENNVVPPNLSVLHLGPLAVDPFSGSTLVYTRTDDRRYSLSSIGPAKRDDNYKLAAGPPHSQILVDSPTQ